MDVSPKQIVSVATALIPFLEHDDANRASWARTCSVRPCRCSVRRRRSSAPAWSIAPPRTPAAASLADAPTAKSSPSTRKAIGVKHDDDGLEHEYDLLKFTRSNAGTCINQRPIVDGRREGRARADPRRRPVVAIRARLALGQNVLVAFMPWEGYNYEDAILISERMVKDDRFTSIHIEEYECEARDTKLGPEEITRDIPNVGEDSLKDLDENGIMRIGAEVRPEDILVGKVTPKGETELTAEERLLRAIFGEKSREVRDTSLKVPHGEKGKIIDVKRFSRENGDELSPGVNHLVRVYVAQKRKILQGDKMAGRHGNKGVIAKVLPEEDMPYTEDGTSGRHRAQPAGRAVAHEPRADHGDASRLGRIDARHAHRNAGLRRCACGRHQRVAARRRSSAGRQDVAARRPHGRPLRPSDHGRLHLHAQARASRGRQDPRAFDRPVLDDHAAAARR